MFNSYTNRFKRMFESINSDTIKAYTRLDKSNGFVQTRIISFKLPSGNELELMTNLPEKYVGKEIKTLYFKRWEIEKNIILI